MESIDTVESWLRSACPTIWSLLTERAKRKLPGGLVQYLSPFAEAQRKKPGGVQRVVAQRQLLEEEQEEVALAKRNLQIIEKPLLALVSSCGYKTVADSYRKAFSGVHTESQLTELLCEVALSASVSALSEKLHLRPPSGKGTFCDVSFQLSNHTVYGEAKRYEDAWPGPSKPVARSLAKAPPGTEPDGTAHSRAMD